MEELFGTSFRNSGALKSFQVLFFPEEKSFNSQIIFNSCKETHVEMDFYYKKLNVTSTIQYSKSSESKMALNIKINVMKGTFLFGK